RSACGQRVNVGYAYMGIGAYAAAEGALRSALVAAERMGLHNVTATARNNLGLALARCGAVEEARRVEAQAIRAAIEQGGKRMEGAWGASLAIRLEGAGHLEAGEREARAAVDILEAAPPARAYALGALAQVLMARVRGGATEYALEALDWAREAMKLLESLGS